MEGYIDAEPFEIMYVDYKIKMNPYGIQFCDDEDKLTMEQLTTTLTKYLVIQLDTHLQHLMVSKYI